MPGNLKFLVFQGVPELLVCSKMGSSVVASGLTLMAGLAGN